MVCAWSFRTSAGGIENHVRFLVRELASRGHDVRVFVAGGIGTPRRTIVEDGLTFQVVRMPGVSTLPAWVGRTPGRASYAAAFAAKSVPNVGAGALSSAVRRWDPDVVWQHDFVSSALAIRLLARRYPVVLTNHTGEYIELNTRRATRPLLKWLLQPYTAVIGPSRQLTPATPNAETIPNGVDVDLFRPPTLAERAAARSRLLPGREAGFVVLCPRRWAPTKGVIDLARAIGFVASRPDLGAWTFVFVGEDHRAYPGYAREVAATLDDVSGLVVRLPPMSIYDLVPYYHAADVVAIPSLLEATSLAALEAMACAVPVVATRVGGLPEIITDGHTGLLVEPRDPSGLAAGLERLWATPAERAQMGLESRSEVVRAYRWSAIAERVEAVLVRAAAIASAQ